MFNSLLYSRKQTDISPTKLHNLSPQKYGKGAFADLGYTPSKLADNVLYREVTTMKKVEEGSSKIRQFEAMSSFMKERLTQLQQERDGIEQSLNHQITMYKKMLHEMEVKHEARLRQIQKKFSLEIKSLIQEKEEEAKFAQSEKQLLENRIEQLENQHRELSSKLSDSGNSFENIKNTYQKLIIEHKHLNQKYNNSEMQRKIDYEKAKDSLEEINKRFVQSEITWNHEIQTILRDKEKQLQNIERILKTEIEKIENQKMNESLRKNQEIKDLSLTFDGECKRLNEIICSKEQVADKLSQEVNQNKVTILEITKHYEGAVSDLLHEKDFYHEQAESLFLENTKMNEHIRNQEKILTTQSEEMKKQVHSLKEDLQFNQLNFIRERDSHAYSTNDMQKQIYHLQNQNSKVINLISDNEQLTKEILGLRDLLLESTFEMERCKEEIRRLAYERDNILAHYEKVAFENEAIYRNKKQVENEASKWRANYFVNRNHY